MIRQKTIIVDDKLTTQLVQTSYKRSRPPGKQTRLPFNGQPQQLTNRKFMSSSQKAAFDQGEEIWV